MKHIPVFGVTYEASWSSLMKRFLPARNSFISCDKRRESPRPMVRDIMHGRVTRKTEKPFISKRQIITYISCFLVFGLGGYSESRIISLVFWIRQAVTKDLTSSSKFSFWRCYTVVTGEPAAVRKTRELQKENSCYRKCMEELRGSLILCLVVYLVEMHLSRN